jgi:type II secretory pathway component PulJ
MAVRIREPLGRGRRFPLGSPPLSRAVWTRLRAEGGFTLVELLVTIMLASAVGVAILMTFMNVTRVFDSQEVRIQNQDDARTAINQMARYVRSATSSVDNLTSQSNAIATAQPQDIEFYCDVDGDGVAERARYYLNGTTLRMQTAEPTYHTGATPYWDYPASYQTDGIVVQEAVRNGTAPVFSYYFYVTPGVLSEFSYAPTSSADRQSIVSVSISISVNERPELAASNVQLATDVQIRQRYNGGLTE